MTCEDTLWPPHACVHTCVYTLTHTHTKRKIRLKENMKEQGCEGHGQFVTVPVQEAGRHLFFFFPLQVAMLGLGGGVSKTHSS